MEKVIMFLFCFVMVSVVFTSCSDDEDMPTTDTFELAISGLEDLGNDYAYEGWIIVNGNAITTGTFSVDANGVLSQTSFNVNSNDLANATKFVLAIEPSPDSDSAPSDVHILAGNFSGDSASLTIHDEAALANDFSSSAGTYILATPTDGMDNNEKSGIWFIDPSSGSLEAGLDLPTLPAGWAYEGWAVIDGTPVSTGTFTSVDMADSAAPFSGSLGGPPFPGEDFIVNAPSGLTFPTDLAGGTAVISIEPVPDNSTAPFLLKPLVSMISNDALDHTPYQMGQNLSFPTGTVNR